VRSLTVTVAAAVAGSLAALAGDTDGLAGCPAM